MQPMQDPDTCDILRHVTTCSWISFDGVPSLAKCQNRCSNNRPPSSRPHRQLARSPANSSTIQTHSGTQNAYMRSPRPAKSTEVAHGGRLLELEHTSRTLSQLRQNATPHTSWCSARGLACFQTFKRYMIRTEAQINSQTSHVLMPIH